jgi:hypothetical protein
VLGKHQGSTAAELARQTSPLSRRLIQWFSRLAARAVRRSTFAEATVGARAPCIVVRRDGRAHGRPLKAVDVVGVGAARTAPATPWGRPRTRSPPMPGCRATKAAFFKISG